MLVRYETIVPADCTSDPHIVYYSEVKALKKRLAFMLADIKRVCESPMVFGVRSVRANIGNKTYASDIYDEKMMHTKKQAPASRVMAKKYKTEGLYFFVDNETGSVHVPPGLSGLSVVTRRILANPKQFKDLSIGVVWKFAMQSSCSDYIEIATGHAPEGDLGVVNYGSQDSWIEEPGYKAWCNDMEKFLNKDFPTARR